MRRKTSNSSARRELRDDLKKLKQRLFIGLAAT